MEDLEGVHRRFAPGAYTAGGDYRSGGTMQLVWPPSLDCETGDYTSGDTSGDMPSRPRPDVFLVVRL